MNTETGITTILAQIEAHRTKKDALLNASMRSLKGFSNGECSIKEVKEASSNLNAWNKTMRGHLRALKAVAKGNKNEVAA